MAPDSEKGAALGPRALKQIQNLILESARRLQNERPQSGKWHSQQTIRAVILDAALDVATHALTGATSALATRCIWSPTDEEYTETEQQITVWNHSESDEYEINTFGKAEWIDGHWWFMGDCGPMASR
jgi:hypothetical protein